MSATSSGVNPNKNASLLEEALASVREGIVPLLDANGRLMFDSNDNPITARRYREEDAKSVILAVLRRSKQLSGYIYQLVRVARLASFCTGSRPIHEFFFSNSVQLTRVHFEQIIDKAVEENRLPSTVARIVEDRSDLAREKPIIEFVEPAMRSQGGDECYKIHYGNIPPVAAIFDILCYTLTSDLVRSILLPVLGQGPLTSNANIAARKLRSTFIAWLTEALGKSQAARNATIIQRYLARRAALCAGSIDDDMIFDFWVECALSASSLDAAVDDPNGFRRYRNAASSLLRFGRVLYLSQKRVGDDLAITDRVPFSGQPDDVPVWQSPLAGLFSSQCLPVKWVTTAQAWRLHNYLDGYADACGHHTVNDEDADGIDIANDPKDYQSGLIVSYAKLSDLDGPAGSLMGVDKFDLRFIRTLLRVDVFGAAQDRIINGIRERKNKLARDLDSKLKAALVSGDTKAQREIKRATDALTSCALKLREYDFDLYLPTRQRDHFVQAKAEYAHIRNDVRKTILASIRYLLDRIQNRQKAFNADPLLPKALITLVSRVGSEAVIKYCFGPEKLEKYYDEQIQATRARLDREMAPRIDKDDQYNTQLRYVSQKLILAELKYSEQEEHMLNALVAAYHKKTNISEVDSFIRDVKRANPQRVGFKTQDIRDPTLQTAYIEAAEFLAALLKCLLELDKAIERVLRKDSGLFDRDYEKFSSVLEKLYCENETPPYGANDPMEKFS
jgi:hypothetical protein